MSIKWGTDSKVQYVEPTYGFPLNTYTHVLPEMEEKAVEKLERIMFKKA